MKFRSYQFFYLLSVVLIVATLCSTLMQIIETNGATNELTNFKLIMSDSNVSYAPVALGVVLIVAGLVNIFAFIVAGFRNFELQKRVSVLGILLILGYYLLLGIYAWVLSSASLTLELPVLFPFFVLVFNALAFFAARRTEAAILAKASGFRLRD